MGCLDATEGRLNRYRPQRQNKLDMSMASVVPSPFSLSHPCAYLPPPSVPSPPCSKWTNLGFFPIFQISLRAMSWRSLVPLVLRNIWTQASLYFIKPPILHLLCYDCGRSELCSRNHRTPCYWSFIFRTHRYHCRLDRGHVRHRRSDLDGLPLGCGCKPWPSIGPDHEYICHIFTWLVRTLPCTNLHCVR